MTDAPLAILTAQGYRVVASQTGGSIPKGLALTLVPFADDETDANWSVTHIKSACRIGPGFEHRGDAQRVAEALVDVADWQLPPTALLCLPGITQRVADALERILSELDRGE